MKKEQADRIVEEIRNMFYPKEIFNHEALSGREVISINDLRTALESVELTSEREVLSKDEVIDVVIHGMEYGWKLSREEAGLPEKPMDVNYTTLQVNEATEIIDRYLKFKKGETK